MPSNRALLIGAYGGEHLGDAAILGGVLLRLARQETISSAAVASFRPDRTRRLVASIEPAVPLEVVPHGLAAIGRHLRDADLLVWAGGPLSDSPRLLARNLAVVARARARGTPFVVEGVGIGAPMRRVSRSMVAALLGLAGGVTVRSTAAAAAVARLSGRPAVVAPDPAFDYLATRRTLDLMTPEERARIDQLVSRPLGTRLVCVNARPALLRARRPAAAAALKELATALSQFARIHPTRYVFFPLETEPDTAPDLDAGHELSRHLPSDVDFRIWSERPGIDGTLGLLRRADAAVTMRLHAAVFALSQGVPTVGIDYYAQGGGRGKVSDLFEDSGVGDRVVTIADLDPERLVRMLAGATAAATPRIEDG